MPTDEDFAQLEQLLDDSEETPRLIATHYTGPEEAVEMVRAAQLLGLGVRLQNRLRVDEAPNEDGEETATEEWVLDLYDGPPETDEE